MLGVLEYWSQGKTCPFTRLWVGRDLKVVEIGDNDLAFRMSRRWRYKLCKKQFNRRGGLDLHELFDQERHVVSNQVKPIYYQGEFGGVFRGTSRNSFEDDFKMGGNALAWSSRALDHVPDGLEASRFETQNLECKGGQHCLNVLVRDSVLGKGELCHNGSRPDRERFPRQVMSQFCEFASSLGVVTLQEERATRGRVFVPMLGPGCILWMCRKPGVSLSRPGRPPMDVVEIKVRQKFLKEAKKLSVRPCEQLVY